MTLRAAAPSHEGYFHLLSGIRGVAAVFVVLRHLAAMFGLYQYPVTFVSVDLFFVLSGVVLEARYAPMMRQNGKLTRRRFMWLRWARIYPLYMLGTLVSLAILALTPWHGLNFASYAWPVGHLWTTVGLALVMFPYLVPGMFEFPLNAPAWSLFFEIAVNLVYAALVTVLSDGVVAGILLGCGAWLLHGLLHFQAIHLADLGPLPVTLSYGFARAGWSFFMGVAVYRLFRRFPLAVLTRFAGPVTLAVLVVEAVMVVAPVPEAAQLVYYLVCVVLLIPALIFVALHVLPGPFARQVYDTLGDVSYPVYTLHIPLFFVFCAVTAHGPPLAVWQYVPWLGIGFLVALGALSWVVDRFIDRPLQKILRAVGRARRVAA